MNEKMSKNELISNISDKTNVAKIDCEAVIDALAEEVKKCLVQGNKLVIKGFVKFEVINREKRKGRNPKTGAVDVFPESKSIRCKISKLIKDAVNGK